VRGNDSTALVYCQDDSCASSRDGICDEPPWDDPEAVNFCVKTTDTLDCLDTCLYANDGQCDEPEYCLPGTDSHGWSRHFYAPLYTFYW
jgi:hypothetical protein